MASRKPGDALRLDLAVALQTDFFEEIGPEPSKAPARSFPKLRLPTPGFRETGPAQAGFHPVDPALAQSRIGDVVLSRKGEDIVAYFLASAFDDADQGITHVIRGEDLFDFTPIQVILQRLFGLPTPVYHHHRLIRDDQGKRLAKRDDARALSKYRAEGATPADIRRMVGLTTP